MRTVLFCVDWKTENSVSYQIRVGKSIKSNPVCTSLGWQIITLMPCFTLSATHASRRSGATASAFITCFRHRRKVARDNTAKYRRRTLQLLPGMERPSYAGAVMEVLEGLDGQLAVRYQGEIIPSQEAPPRPDMLRSFNGSFSNGSAPRLELNGLGRCWEAALTALNAGIDASDADDTVEEECAIRIRKTAAMPHRKPTPLQTAKWKAVQKAKRRGLAIRGVAREVGIHRDTAKKYMEAESPPMKRSTVRKE